MLITELRITYLFRASLTLRRGGDLNSRDPCEPAAFRERCLQPLSHLSRWTCRHTIFFMTINQSNRRPLPLFLFQTKTPSVLNGECFCETGKLDASDVLGIRTLWALSDFEGDVVTDAKFGKRDTRNIVGMEEEVLRLAFASNETKSFVRNDSLDCSCHGNNLMINSKESSTKILESNYDIVALYLSIGRVNAIHFKLGRLPHALEQAAAHDLP